MENVKNITLETKARKLSKAISNINTKLGDWLENQGFSYEKHKVELVSFDYDGTKWSLCYCMHPLGWVLSECEWCGDAYWRKHANSKYCPKCTEWGKRNHIIGG